MLAVGSWLLAAGDGRWTHQLPPLIPSAQMQPVSRSPEISHNHVSTGRVRHILVVHDPFQACLRPRLSSTPVLCLLEASYYFLLFSLLHEPSVRDVFLDSERAVSSSTVAISSDETDKLLREITDYLLLTRPGPASSIHPLSPCSLVPALFGPAGNSTILNDYDIYFFLP